MIVKASGNETTTADELARLMRPAIGLTKPQALANQKLYESVKTTLIKNNPKMRVTTAEKRAREAAAKYAAKQHRYRAQCIARTELSEAYNTGGFAATLDAREKGYIGDCKKTWLTADNERVCEECGALEGESVNMDAPFSNGKLFPPAHPQCMCGVAYEEISPSVLTLPSESGIIETSEQNDVTSDLNGRVSNTDIMVNSIESPIEQRNSGKGNPSAISHFDRPLNERQERLNGSITEYGARVTVPKTDANMTDLAALTAANEVEYAMFTKGGERLIIRGDISSVPVDLELAKELSKAGYKWSGHTHPGFDRFILFPSKGDTKILKIFPQEFSAIYNSLGQHYKFGKE
ncbi:hypothetical protein FACS1894120_5300 [Clostridia bacterium]|nr:hypothetical protein FACS1894120_5300 [Clostridia bacterium]